jgi:IMP and pyridine-specific 5'-nucleotidase
MKSMLNHSFVLDALEQTAADTFSHFEMLIEDHRNHSGNGPSKLQQLVPSVGTFHTHLPLRNAFIAYNKKYMLTKRRFISISFNEIRHILNLAQIMAFRDDHESEGFKNSMHEWEKSPGMFHAMKPASVSDLPPLILGETANVEKRVSDFQPQDSFEGPKMITFDGDQTLYSDGANFEQNPQLANYIYLLLRHGVNIAVVTAAGYEYNVERYQTRLSGLLAYFKEKKLPPEDCNKFYLFGGECNYLLSLGPDYKLRPVKETGPGGWHTATKFISDAPCNWEESGVNSILDIAYASITDSVRDLKIRGNVIRKKRSIGLIKATDRDIPREALDETVLRVQEKLDESYSVNLPFCAFNGGSDVWVDVGNKRVGVHALAAYLGHPPDEILHIGDQFLNTGNDFAARDICPCIWICNPDETTYILKSILRLAGVPLDTFIEDRDEDNDVIPTNANDVKDATDAATSFQSTFSTATFRNELVSLDSDLNAMQLRKAHGGSRNDVNSFFLSSRPNNKEP